MLLITFNNEKPFYWIVQGEQITFLENTIAKLNEDIAILDYSNKEHSNELLSKYDQLKNELDQIVANWEDLNEELDQLN